MHLRDLTKNTRPQPKKKRRPQSDVVRQRSHRARVKRAKRADPKITAPVEPLTGEYDVIVIDPPWPVAFQARTDAPGQVKFDYARMSIEEIQAIPKTIGLPMADNCHVWLWTTQRFLPEAFKCFEVWGVRYVCTFVWDKRDGMKPMNLPRFTCEFVVYGRKGAPSFLDETAFDTCFHAPRGKPSEKPEEFYAMIRRVTGGRRADMFARRKIDGFDAWGAEAPRDGDMGRAEAVG